MQRPVSRGAALATALVLAWLLLFRDTLVGLVAVAPRNAMLIDLALAAGLVGLLARHIATGRLVPVVRPAPLAVVVAATIAHLLDARFTQIDLASGIFMVVGAWGLLGLYVPRARWMQALPLLLAGLCALPVGPALDLYVGFPLRTATADIAFAVLAPVLPAELVTETIIVVDSGTVGMQVDLPCSGVRSLWSGAVFWAAATWIERSRIGVAWWLTGVAFVVVLVGTNLVRVLALVSLYTFAPSAIAEMLHVALGLIAFAAACTIGWFLLRLVPRALPPAPIEVVPHTRATLGIVIGLLVAAAIPVPYLAAREPTTPTIDWAQPVALQESEVQLFRSRGAVAVGKWNIEHGSARAQLLLVHSRSWRAQHRPDVCHAANGRRIDDERTVMLETDFPVRVLSLHGDAGAAWGIYWFQSKTTITDDHDARVWSGFSSDADDWVMVSLVVPADLDVTHPEVVAMLQLVRAEAHALVTAETEN